MKVRILPCLMGKILMVGVKIMKRKQEVPSWVDAYNKFKRLSNKEIINFISYVPEVKKYLPLLWEEEENLHKYNVNFLNFIADIDKPEEFWEEVFNSI
jgi:hypothetical protein